jgi:hypothetical protein
MFEAALWLPFCFWGIGVVRVWGCAVMRCSTSLELYRYDSHTDFRLGERDLQHLLVSHKTHTLGDKEILHLCKTLFDTRIGVDSLVTCLWWSG